MTNELLCKAKCIDCWETLGDYNKLFKIPEEIMDRIVEHVKKGHGVQEIEILQ